MPLEVRISVSLPKRDWLALERKISRGISIERAADEAGIPIDEVFQHLKDRSAQYDSLNYELRRVGQRAVKKALTKLSQLASGDVREGKDFESTDLEAAKALAKLGMDALKLSRSGVQKSGPEDDGRDLFDTTPDPWALKKVE